MLGPRGGGGAEGPEAARLMPANLALGEKNGYLFVMTSMPSGTFFLDQDGIVHQNWGREPASANNSNTSNVA